MSGSFFNLLGRNVRDIAYTYNAMVRVNFGSTLLTIAAIAATLTIPCLFYIFLQTFRANTTDMAMGRGITVYLKSELDPAEAARIRNDLLRDPLIREAVLITKSEGLKSFSAALGIDEKEALADEVNPLPHAVVLVPSDAAERDGRGLEVLAKRLRLDKNVETVRMDRDWLRKVRSVADALRFVTAAVSAALLFSLALTVISSVSGRVLFHREEIEVMKLVGATDNYIVVPYMYLGMWLGLLGCLGALWLGTIVVFATEKYLAGIAAEYDMRLTVTGLSGTELCVVLLFVVSLCMITAFFAAKSGIAKIRAQ